MWTHPYCHFPMILYWTFLLVTISTWDFHVHMSRLGSQNIFWILKTLFEHSVMLFPTIFNSSSITVSFPLRNNFYRSTTTILDTYDSIPSEHIFESDNSSSVTITNYSLKYKITPINETWLIGLYPECRWMIILDCETHKISSLIIDYTMIIWIYCRFIWFSDDHS